MNINTLFRKSTNNSHNRQKVFDTLLRLQKNNPQIVLLYREGRRADDDFIKTSLKIEPRLFERIKYSSEWRIFIDSKYSQQTSLAFLFKHNVLDEIMPSADEFNVDVPFSLKINIWLNELGCSLSFLVSKFSGKHNCDVEKEDSILNKATGSKSKRRYSDNSGS